jgi:Beta-propeller repeat
VASLWLRFEGSQPTLADNGDIILKTGAGEVRQHKSRVWQEATGQRTEVKSRYALSKSGDVGFVLSNYDQSADLIVDPIVSYSTYLSGTSTDSSAGMAVDVSGYTYLTGQTYSVNFPATSETNRGNGDVFVTKLNPSGTGIVYSTIIGGSQLDGGRGIASDSAGNAYVTGYTRSTDFPVTVNHFSTGQHAFALKLDITGNILYSTALGGNDVDIGVAIATDAS